MLVPYLVWLSAFFDFTDGFAARMLKVSSPLGKELDSLSDMVSFGVVPAYLVYAMLASSSENAYLPYVAFLLAAFSALRLAKFNIDERQTDQFIGLPTPANVLFLTGILFLQPTLPWINQPMVLVAITVIFSYLLVAELPLIALKFKDASWKKNISRYLLIIVSIIGLIIFKLAAIPFIIIFYILLSIVNNQLLLKKGSH